MKLGFFVNDIERETPAYTTTRLAMTAANLGHEVWYLTVEDFSLTPDDAVCARARTIRRKNHKSFETYIRELQSPRATVERINVDELDILMLRNDPSLETGRRAWAQQTGILFGRLAMRRGVVVLNDPDGLSKAMNKMYFQHFPEEVRPATLISRDRNELRAFAREYGTVVFKPVQGSGGKNVFLARPEDQPNLNQMIDAISRDGYVVAQEYLKAAEEGDIRLFLMNGQPLRNRGRYAAFRRLRSGGDLRTNVHAGGGLAEAEITDSVLELAEIVRPKLVMDGMFLVGLDIVGDKLMEINVFSPGGLGNAHRFTGVRFERTVIAALERKVQYMKFYRRRFDNVEMAML